MYTQLTCPGVKTIAGMSSSLVIGKKIIAKDTEREEKELKYEDSVSMKKLEVLKYQLNFKFIWIH